VVTDAHNPRASLCNTDAAEQIASIELRDDRAGSPSASMPYAYPSTGDVSNENAQGYHASDEKEPPCRARSLLEMIVVGAAIDREINLVWACSAVTNSYGSSILRTAEAIMRAPLRPRALSFCGCLETAEHEEQGDT